jgi:hypothetical protein
MVAATGPKMAELAGRVGDGICVPVGSTMAGLVAVARAAQAGSDHDQRRLLVTALLSSWPERTGPPVGADVDRLILYVAPPFEKDIARLSDMVGRWRI